VGLRFGFISHDWKGHLDAARLDEMLAGIYAPARILELPSDSDAFVYVVYDRAINTMTADEWLTLHDICEGNGKPMYDEIGENVVDVLYGVHELERADFTELRRIFSGQQKPSKTAITDPDIIQGRNPRPFTVNEDGKKVYL
jgi:hypothetical protein